MKYCPLCKAKFEKSFTTVTIDSGESIIVIRKVPAYVCCQCGEDWIEDTISEKIEKIVNTAKKNHSQVEIHTMIA